MVYPNVPSPTLVSSTPFGVLPSGQEVVEYTLRNTQIELRLITFGARVASLRTLDRDGAMDHIVLGYDALRDYVEDVESYVGAIAGRYANLIALSCFDLDGERFHLTRNEGPHTLHGGKEGFDRRNWAHEAITDGVRFTLVSPDGDQGFPGTLNVQVCYLLRTNRIEIHSTAIADRPTVLNLTNHAYFNLLGGRRGKVLDEELTIWGRQFTVVGKALIPTGEIRSVSGTPFDFRHPTKIGARIDGDHEQLRVARGYDHNWVIEGEAGKLRPAARLLDKTTGRVLRIDTTEPGIQFYSANTLKSSSASKAGPWGPRSSVCLETQHFPDSPNQPSFPSTVLRPGTIFSSETVWTFTVEDLPL